MDDKQHYLRLGLFVIVTLTLLFVVLFIVGGRSLFQPKFTVETYFDESVSGLEVGAPVKFRGVPLGQVTKIDIAANLYEANIALYDRKAYVVVRVQLNAPKGKEDVSDYIKRGLRFQTQLAGITGQQYLTLDFLDPKRYPPLPFDWTPAYPYVPSAPSLATEIVANVQRFLASLDKADVERLGQNLNALVVTLNTRANELPVAQLSADATALLKATRSAVERMDRVIATTPIDQTVRDIGVAAAQLDKQLANPALRQTVNDAAAFAARLRLIAENGDLDRLVKNLDRTIERADAMIGNNQYDVRVIIEDLRVTADNLRVLSDLAKRYPPGLLFGEPPQKVRLPEALK